MTIIISGWSHTCTRAHTHTHKHTLSLFFPSAENNLKFNFMTTEHTMVESLVRLESAAFGHSDQRMRRRTGARGAWLKLDQPVVGRAPAVLQESAYGE